MNKFPSDFIFGSLTYNFHIMAMAIIIITTTNDSANNNHLENKEVYLLEPSGKLAYQAWKETVFNSLPGILPCLVKPAKPVYLIVFPSSTPSMEGSSFSKSSSWLISEKYEAKALLDNEMDILKVFSNSALCFPRLGTRSPWSSKATDILHSLGFKDISIEHGRMLDAKLALKGFDRMTESYFPSLEDFIQALAFKNNNGSLEKHTIKSSTKKEVEKMMYEQVNSVRILTFQVLCD
jgi:hypothetical protein